MPKSGTPNSKVGVDCTTHNSCGDFPFSVPVEDPGEVAEGRDLPQITIFIEKETIWVGFSRNIYYLRKTFGATTSDALWCINVICSWKSQTFVLPICVCQPPLHRLLVSPLLRYRKLYHHVGDHHLLNACNPQDLQDNVKISNRMYWWFPNELTCTRRWPANTI